MIPVTADDLEQIAFNSGAEISMGGRIPTLTLGHVTFAAVNPCPRHLGNNPASDCADGRHDDAGSDF